MYCEDYPCCGHTQDDPCDGAPVHYPDSMNNYCDTCGFNHVGICD